MALLVVGAVAAGGGAYYHQTQLDTSKISDPLTASAAPDFATSEPQAPPAVVLPPGSEGKQNDKGWVLQSMKVQDDGTGGVKAVTRITNANEVTSTAFFTITLSQGGAITATLHSVVNSVAAGQTVTAEFFSTDQINSSEFTYQFQADTSLPG